MTVFQALNLSLLAPPAGVAAYSFQAILDARLAQFLSYYQAAQASDDTLPDIDAQTLALVTDPANIHQRVDAFRETLVTQAINDAILSTFLAWMEGSSLDAYGAGMGIPRASGEQDSSYQTRLQLAWEALAIGGTAGRYQFLALSAAPVDLAGVAVYGAKDVATIPPGQVWIVCLGANLSGVPMPSVVAAVQAATSDRGVRPVNDLVIAQAANVIPYSVDAVLTLSAGADPATVIAQQQAALVSFAGMRRAIGSSVSPDNIAAVLGYNNANIVYDVTVAAPAAKIGGGPFDAPILSGINITWQGRTS